MCPVQMLQRTDSTLSNLAPLVAAVSDFSLRVILAVEFWITEILLIGVLEERLRMGRKHHII